MLQQSIDGANFVQSLDVQKARKELGLEPDAPARIDGMSNALTLMPHQIMVRIGWRRH